MSTPIRRSEPRRGDPEKPLSTNPKRKENPLDVFWDVDPGHWVRAPRSGTLKRRDRGLVVVRANGAKHRIFEAFPVDELIGKHVSDGQHIGEACCTEVRYRRTNSEGKRLNAMRVVKRPVPDPKPVVKRTLWMPGVRQNRAAGGLNMRRGGGITARKVVWHTTESGHDSGAIHWLDDYIKRIGSSYHMLWNPWTGQFCQLYAANVGARALKGGSGGYETNCNGLICIQVSIVGKASERPLAGGSPMKGRANLMAWLDAWDVPHRDITSAGRSRSEFNKSGHTTHASAPYNDHVDPGPIDFKKLWAS